MLPENIFVSFVVFVPLEFTAKLIVTAVFRQVLDYALLVDYPYRLPTVVHGQ